MYWTTDGSVDDVTWCQSRQKNDAMMASSVTVTMAAPMPAAPLFSPGEEQEVQCHSSGWTFFFWGGGGERGGCLTSQQHASVSQGRICSDNFTCCHTEIEVADQTFYLTQSQYTDTGPTSPSADPIMPGALQGSHWSANF